MAGEYGEINSRADYDRVLRDATGTVLRLRARNPTDPVLQRVAKQLEAMRRWSDNGRHPTASERRSIDVGLVAAREFSDAPGPIGELANQLFVLNNYFEDWPSDVEAATPSEDDDD